MLDIGQCGADTGYPVATERDRKFLAPPGVATSSFFISHAARAQKHEKRRRPCSPESWVNHQCQPARSCERFTMCGLGWERICRVLLLCHFVALYARILILHTEHVRHRGGEQQQRQIVHTCAHYLRMPWLRIAHGCSSTQGTHFK